MNPEYCKFNSSLSLEDLPIEVLTIILSRIELPETILQCRLVCQKWQFVIQEKSIWSHKLYRKKDKHFMELDTFKKWEFIQRTPWFILYKITTHYYPFGQNLIKNCCGQDGLEHWTFCDSSSWRAGKISYVDEIQKAHHSKHTTFFDASSRIPIGGIPILLNYQMQRINLPKSGLTNFFSSIFQPKLTISFWLSTQSYVGPQLMRYLSDIYLVDSNYKVKVCCGMMEYRRGRRWHQITYTFENYGSSLNHIKVEGVFHFRPNDEFLEAYDHSYDPYRLKIRDFSVTLDTPNFYGIDWGTLVDECHRSFIMNYSSQMESSYPFFVGLEMVWKPALNANLLPPWTLLLMEHKIPESGIFQTGKWYISTWPSKPIQQGELAILKFVNLINLREFGVCEFILGHLQPTLQACMTSLYEDPISYNMKVRLIGKNGTIIEEKSQSKEICQNDGRQLLVEFEKCSADTIFIEYSVEGIFEYPRYLYYMKTLIATCFHVQLSVPTLNEEIVEMEID